MMVNWVVLMPFLFMLIAAFHFISLIVPLPTSLLGIGTVLGF